MQEKAIIRTAACALFCCFAALCAGLPSAGASDGWRSYEVYQPTVTRRAVIDARAHAHKYNHCSAIAWYEDRWFCLWGSHEPQIEHAAGQRMVFSTSRDGRTWTPIEPLFSNKEYCENAVIYTDDLGKTWHLSRGCQTPGLSWIQWEPTVWEQPDGSVMMFARHNSNWALGHPKPTSGQFFLWSISRDHGQTWSPHRYVPVESVCSRMHVAPLDGRGVWAPAKPDDDFTGRRLVMVHNDAPGGEYP